MTLLSLDFTQNIFDTLSTFGVRKGKAQAYSFHSILMTQPFILERPRHLNHFCAKNWKYLTHLNLFATEPPTNDQYQLENQRISTRVFILIFFLTSYLLVVYTATATSIHTFTVDKPFLFQYNQLHEQYSEALTCPCSQIANRYGSFVTINYSRHPLCTSIFVTDRWINYLGLYRGVLWRNDFRYVARQIFQALQSFCQLTAESTAISLKQFYLTSHVTDVVNDAKLLEVQLNSTIQQFITSTTNQFLLSLRKIGNMTQANALLSGLLTNANLVKGSGSYVITRWIFYGACSCGDAAGCVIDAIMYPNGSRSSLWTLPGFHRICMVLEAVRHSDLRCFFNQTCLDEFHTRLEIDQPLNLTHLDLSTLRRFNANTTVGVIMDELMIDEWQWNISHASYYDTCHPQQCIYRVVSTNGWIVIVTTVVGLVGGLMTALKLIVPRIVWLIRWAFHRRTPRNPGMSIS